MIENLREIGLRKPEHAAFLHGAQAAGLRAVHVRSPQDVRQALVSLGYAPG